MDSQKEIANMTDQVSKGKNQLYPVFLKLEQLNILLVGGGHVAYEKLQALLSNSPGATITVVAMRTRPEVQKILEQHHQCVLFQKVVASSAIAWNGK